MQISQNEFFMLGEINEEESILQMQPKPQSLHKNQLLINSSKHSSVLKESRIQSSDEKFNVLSLSKSKSKSSSQYRPFSALSQEVMPEISKYCYNHLQESV